MSDRLPSRSSQRRMIFVVDPAEIEGGGQVLQELSRQPHVSVLSSQPDHSRADGLVIRLERHGLLQPDRVLLMSPYDDENYQLAEEAADAFCLQKYAAFARVCQLIGAKKTSIRAVTDLKSKERLQVDVNGSYIATKGSLSAEREAVEQLASKLSWSETFSGADADVPEALLHLQNKGLDHDVVLHSLVESRAHQGNPVRKRTVTVDLSQEGSRTLQAAARLDLRLTSVSTELKLVAERSKSFQVTYDVEF